MTVSPTARLVAADGGTSDPYVRVRANAANTHATHRKTALNRVAFVLSWPLPPPPRQPTSWHERIIAHAATWTIFQQDGPDHLGSW